MRCDDNEVNYLYTSHVTKSDQKTRCDNTGDNYYLFTLPATKNDQKITRDDTGVNKLFIYIICNVHFLLQEGYVLLNDTPNTFYIRLYVVRHMVEDHSAKEKTRCRLTGYSLKLGCFFMHHPTKRESKYHGLCYISRGALTEMRNRSLGPLSRIVSDDPSHHNLTLLPRSYISLLGRWWLPNFNFITGISNLFM